MPPNKQPANAGNAKGPPSGASPLEPETARQYLDIAGVIILALDSKGRVKMLNTTGARLLGYTETELLGRDWFKFCVPPGERRKTRAVVLHQINGDLAPVATNENQVLTKDGGLRLIAWKNTPLRDPEGRITGTLSSGEDITHRRKTELELKTHREQLEELVTQRTQNLTDANAKLQEEIETRKKVERELRILTQAVEQSPVSVIVTDAKGTIQYVNPKFTRVTGYNIEEALGENPRILKSGLQTQKYYQEMWQNLNEGKEWHGEFCNVRKDGNTYWESASISPIRNSSKKVTHFVAVKEDITQRKKVEEALQRAHHELEERVKVRTAELKAANEQLQTEIEEHRRTGEQLRHAQKLEAIGTLAGGIAHDFNNILGAIIGYGELLDMFDLPEESPLRPKVHAILQAAYRAQSLVRQILMFSRQSEHQKKPILLTPIFKEVMKLLRASLPATIKIESQLASLQGAVLADATQMHQILMNLCTNAAHAMQKNGGILSVDLIESDIDEGHSRGLAHVAPGPYACLIVSDSGHGIAPEVKERIFDPYFTTKGQSEGTGLGLAVVHGIVKGHQGAITVESRMGHGSSFRVYLPLAEARVECIDTAQSPMPCGTGRVLVVDDEPALASYYEGLLTKLGYAVTAKTSSLAAIELFKTDPQRFDMVITDQTMPDFTGVELARAMLRLRPDLPIVLCTGNSELVARKDPEVSEIAAFIAKPVGAGKLADTVHKLIPCKL